jgi:hypothetical protein
VTVVHGVGVVRESLVVNTEVEVALFSVGTGWALSTLSSGDGSFWRGREAKRTAQAAKLAEVGAAVEALMNAIAGVDYASNGFAAQRGKRLAWRQASSPSPSLSMATGKIGRYWV